MSLNVGMYDALSHLHMKALIVTWNNKWSVCGASVQPLTTDHVAISELPNRNYLFHNIYGISHKLMWQDKYKYIIEF
jgi:hypothetical protein